MVLCPIARMIHCTGCPLVSFCPAKTSLGDYGKEAKSAEEDAQDETSEPEAKSSGSGSAQGSELPD